MRILILYRYYWPDTAPFGRVLASMAKRWRERGHDVTVVTSQPAYRSPPPPPRPRREDHEGAAIYRIRGLPESRKKPVAKIINHVLYAAQTIGHAARRRRSYDLIIVNSYPPVLGGITGRIASWLTGAPFIYNVNDINPESAHMAGYIRKGLLYRLMARLDRGSCRKAGVLVTMSQDMATTLAARGLERQDTVVRNVLFDSAFEEETPPEGFRQTFDDDFVVLFAGNIGKFQGLDTVVDAARLLRENKRIKFVFLGDGVQKESLKQAAGDMVGDSVHFLPFAPAGQAYGAMKHADLGISALRPGIYRVAFPSKTLAYLSAGCPVLAIIEPHSELAREVAEQKLGVVCEQDAPEKLARTIEDAWRDRNAWRERRGAIRAYADRNFQFDAYYESWCDLIEVAAREKGA